MSTNTLGAGFAYRFNDMVALQIGGFYTAYDDVTVDKTYKLGESTIPYTENYDKHTYAFSIGVDISVGGKKK